jgi:hypothetical protein
LKPPRRASADGAGPLAVAAGAGRMGAMDTDPTSDLGEGRGRGAELMPLITRLVSFLH